MNTKKIIPALLLASAIIVSCSKPDTKPNSKTEISLSPLMQGIASAVSGMEVLSETKSNPHRDIILTETDFKCDGKPQHLFIAEVNLGGSLKVCASTSNDKAEIAPSAPMPIHAAAAEQNGKKVYLGINGDVFWGEEGKDRRPAGVFYKDGKDVVYQPIREDSEGALFVLKDGAVGIEKYSEFNKKRDNVKEAIGAWHCIVTDGKKSDYPHDNITDNTNPRTFVGLSKDCRKMYIFVLDGRQKKYSIGLTLDKVAEICLGAGCHSACNLDGGGSSTMIVRKESGKDISFPIINKPYDASLGNVARAISNGLLIYED